MQHFSHSSGGFAGGRGKRKPGHLATLLETLDEATRHLGGLSRTWPTKQHIDVVRRIAREHCCNYLLLCKRASEVQPLSIKNECFSFIACTNKQRHALQRLYPWCWRFGKVLVIVGRERRTPFLNPIEVDTCVSIARGTKRKAHSHPRQHGWFNGPRSSGNIH